LIAEREKIQVDVVRIALMRRQLRGLLLEHGGGCMVDALGADTRLMTCTRGEKISKSLWLKLTTQS